MRFVHTSTCATYVCYDTNRKEDQRKSWKTCHEQAGRAPLPKKTCEESAADRAAKRSSGGLLVFGVEFALCGEDSKEYVTKGLFGRYASKQVKAVDVWVFG